MAKDSKERKAMTVLAIAGKMAPRPSSPLRRVRMKSIAIWIARARLARARLARRRPLRARC